MLAGGPVTLNEIAKSFGEPHSHMVPLNHQLNCIAALEFKFEQMQS